MKRFLFLSFFTCFFLMGCPPLPKYSYDSITYSSTARGKSKVISIERLNKKRVNLTYTFNQKEELSRDLTESEYRQLFDILRYLNPNGLDTLQVPSKKYEYDGAYLTQIELKAQSSVFSSPSFDQDNPPKELISLVDFLQSLIK